MLRWIFPILVGSAVALFAALGLLLATEHVETLAAPSYRVARVGGLELVIHDPADPARTASLTVTG